MDIKKEIIKNIIALHEFMANNYINGNIELKDESQPKLGDRQANILFILVNIDINTLSELKEWLKLSSSSLSLTVSKMVKAGYIEKIYSSEEDNRKVIFALTENGKEIYNKFKEHKQEQFNKIINILSEEEKLKITNSIKDIEPIFNLLQLDEFNIESIDSIDMEKIIKGFIKLRYVLANSSVNFIDELSNTLKFMDFIILYELTNLNIDTPTLMCKILNKSESAVSSKLSTMVKNGYLIREKDLNDSRITHFKITELGQEKMNICNEIIEKKILEFLENFTDEALEKLNKALFNFLELLNIIIKNERGM